MNVGCIPSKSLLNNSHYYHMATHDFKSRGGYRICKHVRHYHHGAGIKATVELDLPTMLKAKEKSVGTLTKGVEGLFSKYSTFAFLVANRIH